MTSIGQADCCKELRANMSLVTRELAIIARERAQFESNKKELDLVKEQLAEHSTLVEKLTNDIYEVRNKERMAKLECDNYKKREKELEKQMKVVEQNSATLRKKADLADTFQSRFHHVVKICDQVQLKRVQQSEHFKEMLAVCKKYKADNEALAENLERQKAEKNAYMMKTRMYKKHMPNLFRLIDDMTPLLSNVNHHLRKRIDNFASSEIRTLLLPGAPSTSAENVDNEETSDDEMVEDLESLISGGIKVAAPEPRIARIAVKKEIRSPEKQKDSQEKVVVREIKDAWNSDPPPERKPPALIEAKNVRAPSAGNRGRGRGGRFTQQSHNVEVVERALETKLQDKWRRTAEEQKQIMSEVLGGHSTIHGKKGPTVREQQSGMMSVKEKVAMMRSEGQKSPVKKAPVAVNQPSTSKASVFDLFADLDEIGLDPPQMVDSEALLPSEEIQPVPQRERTVSEISHSSDMFGLRMTPSPLSSPLKATPSESVQSLAGEEIASMEQALNTEEMEYIPPDGMDFPSTSSMPHLDAIEAEINTMTQELEEIRPVEGSIQEATEEPVQPEPIFLRPSTSMPHLEAAHSEDIEEPEVERPSNLRSTDRVAQAAVVVKQTAESPKKNISSPMKVQFLKDHEKKPSTSEIIKEPTVVVTKTPKIGILSPKKMPDVKPALVEAKAIKMTPEKKAPEPETMISPTTDRALRNMRKISAEILIEISPVKSRPVRPMAPKAKKGESVPDVTTASTSKDDDSQIETPAAVTSSKRQAHEPKEQTARAKPNPAKKAAEAGREGADQDQQEEAAAAVTPKKRGTALKKRAEAAKEQEESLRNDDGTPEVEHQLVVIEAATEKDEEAPVPTKLKQLPIKQEPKTPVKRLPSSSDSAEDIGKEGKKPPARIRRPSAKLRQATASGSMSRTSQFENTAKAIRTRLHAAAAGKSAQAPKKAQPTFTIKVKEEPKESEGLPKTAEPSISKPKATIVPKVEKASSSITTRHTWRAKQIGALEDTKPVNVPLTGLKRKAGGTEIFNPKRGKTVELSAESLLQTALDYGCDEQEITKRMKPEDLALIRSLGAEKFSEIMMERVIRMNRVDMWFSVMSNYKKKSSAVIPNTLEENLLQVSHSLSGGDIDVITPFNRKLLFKIFGKSPLDDLLCYKIVRLIAIGCQALSQLSSKSTADISKTLKNLVSFLAYYRPHDIGKSLVYMVNRLPLSFLEFFVHEEFEDIRRIFALYSGEETSNILQFFWNSKCDPDNALKLLTRRDVDLWIDENLSITPEHISEVEFVNRQLKLSTELRRFFALRAVYLTSGKTISIPIKEAALLNGKLEELMNLYQIENKEDSIVDSIFGSRSGPLNDPTPSTISELALRFAALTGLLDTILRISSTIGRDKEKLFLAGLRKSVETIHTINEYLSRHQESVSENRHLLLSVFKTFLRNCQVITLHTLC